jgi:transposase-like protein
VKNLKSDSPGPEPGKGPVKIVSAKKRFSKGEPLMKKRIKRIAQKSNKKLQEITGQMEVDLVLPIAEVLTAAQWHIEQLAGAAGMKIIQQIIQDDVRQLAGESRYARDGKEGQRWGSQPGWVSFAGRKVTVAKPRIRSKEKQQEMLLPNYERLQEKPRLAQAMMDQIALGLSMRNYEHSIEALCEGYGVKKSSVSRQFIAASRRELEQLLDRKLSDLDIGAVFLDGIHRGGQCVIVALGVSREGHKHCLGLWQGATENGAVCESLLQDLIDRGLDPKQRRLFIIDGAKALCNAIRKKFGSSEIHRCQIHKRRNVVDHLPKIYQSSVERRLKAAYGMSSYKDAKDELNRVVDYLEGLNPSAARSLEEGLEETLTLHRLGVPDALRISLKSTNIIESSLARVEDISGRVKRWRGGDHLQRWTAKALLIAEKKWRKVRGWQSMAVVMDALNSRGAEKEDVPIIVAR